MMLRRTLLLGLAFLGLSQACSKSSSNVPSQAPSPSTDLSDSLPPHCAALSLVWKTQQEQIKKLELEHANAELRKHKLSGGGEGRWWLDTDERRWTVTRPFGPGGYDSTHWFGVTYHVGAESLSWAVDTRESKVSLSKESANAVT